MPAEARADSVSGNGDLSSSEVFPIDDPIDDSDPIATTAGTAATITAATSTATVFSDSGFSNLGGNQVCVPSGNGDGICSEGFHIDVFWQRMDQYGVNVRPREWRFGRPTN